MQRLSAFAITAAILTTLSTGATSRNAAGSTAPSAVPADIRAILGKPIYKHATWGIRVLDGSKVLIDLHPQKKFFIGSVRKVFSVGQLLDAVGAGHRYNTPVYRTGAVRGGVLHGNLVIVASGDLTMGGRRNPDGSIAVSDWDHNEADSLGNAILTKPNPLAGYEQLARAVRAAGITRVDGDVVVDDRLFKPFDFRGEFNVRPIYVNDDVVDLSIVNAGGSVGSKTSVNYRPVSAALAIANNLRNGAANSKATYKVNPQYPKCIGTAGCASAIDGSLPIGFTPPLTGGNTLVQTVRITQPSNYARTVFVESLRKAGVTVGAPTVKQNPTNLLPSRAAYTASNRVALLQGMTYGQDAKLILKISYNIGADTSIVLFGLTRGVNSMPAALAVERKNLATRFGIAPNEYYFVDGSGGGDTTATDHAVTQVLQELQRRPAFPTLYADLPILAVDGSLASVKDFEKDRTLAGAAGKIRAKTGTYVAGSPSGGPVLKGQAFGGYITTKSGKHLVYQLVVNNVPITSIADVIGVFQDEGTISAMLWRDY
ncbi:MAG: D-alanyl-D-alanine carboxypeptidase [Candidatus Eremiobacteraeota bacterium]|nr:D-alanyl-D-alanine carboxypeptidase [Candidatus Eremiobacteraeota bacterium]